jgi:hypothetical protein
MKGGEISTSKRHSHGSKSPRANLLEMKELSARIDSFEVEWLAEAKELDMTDLQSDKNLISLHRRRSGSAGVGTSRNLKFNRHVGKMREDSSRLFISRNRPMTSPAALRQAFL